MTQVFICDAIRTPCGRYGGALSSVRTADLGAIPLRALMARNASVDRQAVMDVIFGCANPAGEAALTIAGGVDSMPETAEDVAIDYKVERAAQDRMALASPLRAVAAQKAGHLAREITPVTIPQKKGDAGVVSTDEHPRETSLETLAGRKGVVRPDGTVTAGNASGARLATTVGNRRHATGGRYALYTMCIGVGQGIAPVLGRV